MNKVYLVSFVLLQILFSLKAFAKEPLIFRGENTLIGKHVYVLEDATNTLSISTVFNSKDFVRSEVGVPSLKLSKSTFWLKFSVNNESPNENLLLTIEYPTLDVCEFYRLENGEYVVDKLSDSLAFKDRKYKHQNFILDVHIPRGSTQTFYLRVESSEDMLLPIILGTPQKTAESILSGDLVWGTFIGLLLVMILYNFFVYVSTKDISYLYYVLYTIFTALTQTSLSGYTYRYFFYDSPALFNKALVVFPGIQGIFGVLFIISFLQSKDKVPKLHKLFSISILLYSLAVVLRLVGFDHESTFLIPISALSSIFIIYIVAIKIALQGYRPAKYFLLAWSMFFAGLIIFILLKAGVVPYNNFTNYGLQLGTALEITLLSLALADRINIFKKEKEKSQEETLIALKENERIIREQNVILEAKVEERTSELTVSNSELNRTLTELKEAESQLVESEKMASLGQLTAGIAHEINNPINFITSNVNPLKRDVEILLEAINKIESIGTSEGQASEKSKQIEEYKEEIDFDYLKIEINHLLKGINDGASRTAEIVKGLRIFSRLDEDDLKNSDMNEGLDSTLIIVNNLFNNKIKVIKDYRDIPPIECYPGKLNQVFLNIISNAIYAINKKHGDKPDGILKISTSHDEHKVYIKIEDNGTGMDDTTKRKIFEPFFTTKDVGEGTGLGMSITYNTIKKHNGQIVINSSLGSGTEFILELPTIHEIISV